MTPHDEDAEEPPQRFISIFGRRFALPRSRGSRIALGCGLMVGGVFGVLPILGWWMIPVGLLVLSHDFAPARRWRRRLAVRFGRRGRS